MVFPLRIALGMLKSKQPVHVQKRGALMGAIAGCRPEEVRERGITIQYSIDYLFRSLLSSPFSLLQLCP